MTRTQRERIEFGDRGSAKRAREELDDEVLHDRDDGREAAVVVDTTAIDERDLSEVRGEAVESIDSRRGQMAGQASLTDAERKRIDFTETSVPEARTAKASLQEQGIDDWWAYFDPTLTTSEMASIAQSTQASGGQRMDQADTERAQQRRGAQAVRRQKEGAESHARDGCKSGFDEACEELAERHGVSADEIARIRPDGTAVMQDGTTIDASMLRAGSHGRMLREPPQPAPNVEGYRKASSGRFVGFDMRDPGIERDQSTGQLVNTGPERAISRRELRARYGHHNTGERNFDQMSEPEPTTSDGPTFDRGVFTDVVRTEAAARGVTPEPAERQESMVADGLGGVQFNRHAGGFVETDLPEQETKPPDIQRGEDPFVEMERDRRGEAAAEAGVLDPNGGNGGSYVGGPFDITSGMDEIMTDDRDQQDTLDVGAAAGVTEDRTGKLAGSAGFEDRRDELGTSGGPDPGEQTGLGVVETDVGGDGQTDLFGGDASTTEGAEFLEQPDAVTEGDDPYRIGNAGSFNSPYESKDKEDKYS